MFGASTLTRYNARIYEGRAPDLRESRLRKALKLICAEPPGHLLDLGCGTGDFSARLVSLGWGVFGIDLGMPQLVSAMRRGLKPAVADVSRPLPFRNECFDCVFAGELIEHLVDTDTFVSELFRITKPGGAVLLTTPNLASFENRIRLLFGIYPLWVNYRLEEPGHVRAFTPRVLKRLLREHGFRVEKHVGNWVPFVPQRYADDVRQPWLALTGDLFPGLSMDIIVKARKP